MELGQVIQNDASYTPVRRKLTKDEFYHHAVMKGCRSGINTCGIGLYVCSFLNLVIGVMPSKDEYYDFFNILIAVIVLLGFGLGIHLGKSRVCAIILLVSAIINTVRISMISGETRGYYIIVIGIYAVRETFRFQKAWEQYELTGRYPGIENEKVEMQRGLLEPSLPEASITPSIKPQVNALVIPPVKPQVTPQVIPSVKSSVTPADSPVQSVAMGKVQCTKGVAFGQGFQLPANSKVVVGKNPNKALLVINDPRVSNIHCSIQYNATNNTYVVTDHSTNGTYVNGMRLQRDVPVPYPAGTVLVLVDGSNEIKLG